MLTDDWMRFRENVCPELDVVRWREGACVTQWSGGFGAELYRMEPNYCLPVGLNLSSLSRGVIGPRYAQFSEEIDGAVKKYPSPPTELYPDTHRCTCATKDVTKHLFLSDADEEGAPEHSDGGMVLMG